MIRSTITLAAMLPSFVGPTKLIAQVSRVRDTAATAAEIPFSRTHNFRSKVNGQDYSVMVALPPGYGVSSRQQSDTTRFPVLYLLDGNVSLPLTWSIERSLAADNVIEHPILVGIGYPVGQLGVRRLEDYSPTRDASVDSARSTPQRLMRTGGGSAFLRVLREEIIPLVELNYPVSTNRALLGVSMSGLFAVYAMLEEPSLFDAYAIGSPSLWWDDQWIWKHYQDRGQSRSNVRPRVFITVGAHEWTARRDAQRLATALYRDWGGSAVDYRVAIGADHSTAWQGAADFALRALYARPIRCALTRVAGDTLYKGDCIFGARSILRLAFSAPRSNEPFIWRGKTPGTLPTGGRPFVLSTAKGSRSFRTITEWHEVTTFEADSQNLTFSYVWRIVEPKPQDLQILQHARALLADSTRWNHFDDNEEPYLVTCPKDAARLSLLCALRAAGGAIDNEFFGGRPAIHAVRESIATIAPRDYRHPLVGFNSDAATTFADIQRVLARAIANIQVRVDAAWRPDGIP